MRIPKITIKPYELLSSSNQVLVQRVGDGSIITRFEKTPIPVKPNDVVCPHFLELKWATGCPFSCAWCYLNGTLRFTPRKAQPYFKPRDKIEQHVRTFLENVNGSGELLNTGELADSLMCERNGSPFSTFIISLFRQQDKHKVLFLTKSKHIDNLLNIDHRGQAIVSFSLNAHEVAKRFEKGAHSVIERIEAATKLSNAGYEVRIRIDPMVPVSNWHDQYISLIDDIFSHFVPSRITLGSLRGLQSTINRATDKSWVEYLSENSNWGKRVESTTRYLIYKTIIGHLKERYLYNNIALCKETLSIWDKLGMDYKNIKCNCIL